uniref:Adenomatous polyposis coli protein n=1 Tax=Plectus sambesii TaxID=2011161 RepID=A0A914VRT6_9BILA
MIQLVSHLQRPTALPVDHDSSSVGTRSRQRTPSSHVDHTDAQDGFRSQMSVRTNRTRHPHLPVDKHNGEGSEDYNGFGSNRTTSNQGTASIISFSSSMESSAVSGSSSAQQKQGEALSAPVAIVSAEQRLDRMRYLAHALESGDDLDGADLVHSVVKMMHPEDIWSHPPSAIDSKVLMMGTDLLYASLRCQPDDKRRRRGELIMRVLKEIREYSLVLRHARSLSTESEALARTSCFLPRVSSGITNLLKQSFDADYRRITVFLGGLNAVAELLIGDWTVFSQHCPDSSTGIRRYIGMSLTNLTYGDIASKRSLCAIPAFLDVVVRIIGSNIDELRQVYASVLRNLSWKADSAMRRALFESGAVSGLIRAAMDTRLDATLKSVLSALWNLSSHSRENKLEICRHPDALGFLVSVLDWDESPSSTAIVENASGILKYVSSQIAQREEFRAAVRQRGIFHKLLRHLQSTSLTVVTNACIVLCNLSAHNVDDQRTLLELGARPMLQSLVNSRHAEIARFATLALTNLSSSWPLTGDSMIDSTLSGQDMASSSLLAQRRQKTLERSFNSRLADVLSPMMATMPDDPHSQHSSAHFASPRTHVAKQVMQLVDGVACPVPSAAAVARPYYFQPTPSESYRNDSSKSADERIASKTAQPTREEQMQQDRLAGQRFLSSFNKHNRQKELGDKLTPDDCDSDEVKCFASKDTRDPSPSSSLPRRADVALSSAPTTFAPAPFVVGGGGGRHSSSDSTVDLRSVTAGIIDETEERAAEQSSMCRVEADDGRAQQHSHDNQLQQVMMSAEPPLSESMLCTRSTSMQSLTSEMAGRSTFHSTFHSACSTARTSRRMSPITFDDIPDSPTMLSRHNSVPPSPSKHFSPAHQQQSHVDDDYATFEPRVSSNILDASILAAMPAKKKYPVKAKPTDSSLNDLIQSAMPKPKSKVRPTIHGGKSVAIAKPMLRHASAAAAAAEQCDNATEKPMEASAKENAEEPVQSQSLSATVSPSAKNADKENLPFGSPDNNHLDREQQELLDDCINCAMPKAKPKSRTRRSQQRPESAQAVDEARNAESFSEDVFQSPRKTMLNRLIASNEQGILEASATSLLVQSSTAPSVYSNANSLLMGLSAVSTTLEDMLPPDDLMQISAVSTGALLHNSSTNEKVRDASSLYRQALTAPCNRAFEQQHNLTDPTAVAASGTKTSTDSESLSEDNYSRIDDESFDIAPEDVNLSWVQEDGHHVLIELEARADDDQLMLEDLLDDTEVTIDCETLSCVSTDSRSPRDPAFMFTPTAAGPKILAAHEATAQQRNADKLVRGGVRRSLGSVGSSSKAPPVRTTKSAQLRAKRNSESSVEGNGGGGASVSASVSPSSSMLPRPSSSASNKVRAASVSVLGSGSSSTYTKTPKASSTSSVSNSSTYTKTKPTVAKARPSVNDDKKDAAQTERKPSGDAARTAVRRPPIPPKPGAIAKTPSEAPAVHLDKAPPKSAQSARVTPFNYQRPQVANNTTKSKPSPPAAKGKGSVKESTAQLSERPSDESVCRPSTVPEKAQTGPKMKQILVTIV